MFFRPLFRILKLLISRIVGEGLPLPQSHKILFVLILQNGGNSTWCFGLRLRAFNKKGETDVSPIFAYVGELFATFANFDATATEEQCAHQD